MPKCCPLLKNEECDFVTSSRSVVYNHKGKELMVHMAGF